MAGTEKSFYFFLPFLLNFPTFRQNLIFLLHRIFCGVLRVFFSLVLQIRYSHEQRTLITLLAEKTKKICAKKANLFPFIQYANHPMYFHALSTISLARILKSILVWTIRLVECLSHIYRRVHMFYISFGGKQIGK